MLFLVVVGACYAAVWLVARNRIKGADRWRIAMAGGMAIAGTAHLLDPTPFIQHLPTWMPAREPLIFITGLVEIALGAGLAGPRRWRRLTGLVLAAYLLAVFPANIYVAVAGVAVEGQPGGAYPWVRLLFQPLFVWLAIWSTGSGHRAIRTGTRV